MQIELEFGARFPESLCEPLIWDSEEASVKMFSSTSLAETTFALQCGEGGFWTTIYSMLIMVMCRKIVDSDQCSVCVKWIFQMTMHNLNIEYFWNVSKHFQKFCYLLMKNLKTSITCCNWNMYHTNAIRRVSLLYYLVILFYWYNNKDWSNTVL